MAFEPEYACRGRWVDALAVPPYGLVAGAVQLAMMSPAQRHGELVTNLLSHRTALSKAQMVRIRRLAPTNKTSFLGNQSEVFSITDPPWLRQR